MRKVFEEHENVLRGDSLVSANPRLIFSWKSLLPEKIHHESRQTVREEINLYFREMMSYGSSSTGLCSDVMIESEWDISEPYLGQKRAGQLEDFKHDFLCCWYNINIFLIQGVKKTLMVQLLDLIKTHISHLLCRHMETALPMLRYRWYDSNEWNFPEEFAQARLGSRHFCFMEVQSNYPINQCDEEFFCSVCSNHSDETLTAHYSHSTHVLVKNQMFFKFIHDGNQRRWE